MSLIKCTDLVIGYEGKHIAGGLTFSVESGDYLCIVGENGSGKSTLIRTLLHLQPPISGSIGYGDGLSFRDIGYLPQKTAAQKDFPASCYEVVISGCMNKQRLHPFYTSEQRAKAHENMRKLGIESLKKHCFSELSGGQQQRALLARALCASSKLILLDEPVTGLDPRSAADMYGVIADLNRDGVAVIMISHDITESLKYANRILHISKEPEFYDNASDHIHEGADIKFTRGGYKDDR